MSSPVLPNLPQLAPLDQYGIEVPLAPARPNTAPVNPTALQPATTSGSWLTDAWDNYMSAFNQAQEGAIDNPATAANAATQVATISGIAYGADIAAVLVGLILIAGAVFSFSMVKDTIVTTAKGAASLAA